MIYLELQAPFGVFRPFTSGTFRPTSPFITPSAAYGLLLNVAGIEMRHDDGLSPMTFIAKGLPCFKLSLATLELPGPARQSLLQQLHNYPVGSTGKERAAQTKGNKYNIAPIRREFLADIKACVGVDADSQLETAIMEGLRGKISRRYGLPFLGDNNFLVDRLELVDQPRPAYWFERVRDNGEGMADNVMRLTITVDRADLSRTRSALFAPGKEKRLSPPPDSWIEVGYP